MYSQVAIMTSDEGMRPAGRVTAGRAKMPAPMVVPAMREMLLNRLLEMLSAWEAAESGSVDCDLIKSDLIKGSSALETLLM